MVSDDPEFEEKAADIIGLYLKPPVHAALFCVDEKSASKRWIAWTRFYPFLPAGPNGMASSTTAMERFLSTAP
jgi:hypothetical protein